MMQTTQISLAIRRDGADGPMISGVGHNDDLSDDRDGTGHGTGSGSGTHDDPRLLRAMAMAIYGSRITRADEFGADLFVDPAWDILSVLYLHTPEGGDMGIEDVCIELGMPLATALRWLSVLAERGHVAQRRDGPNAERVMVRLTESSEAAMRRVLSRNIRALERFARTKMEIELG
jgi:DNA-binding MarR family transcriptional regulator